MEQYNKSFAGYIKELREKQNVPLARLCNGVCSANLIKQFEKKEKGVSKNIQDCLLGRLGIGAEGYFYLLGIEEYREWHARAEIIYEIIRRRLDSAEEMLSGYEKIWCDNSLNRQFYYAMMASIARCRKKTRQEIYSLWEAAKNETIPKAGTKNIQNYRLSVQELDILLDYYYYKEESTEKDFRVVLDYIGSHPYDEQAKGKTLPKAFLYYSEKVKEEKELTVELIHELLAEAREIVEIMRERDQMLFLWEMLQFRSELYYLLREKGSEKGKSDEEKKNAGWLWAFEKVYEYFDFPKETTETTILYFTKNVECVNETIRKRRRLLGYSRRQLAKFGDCTERTIERIEKKECSPQKEVAGAILEAMGMPADYSKCALIVEKPGDRDLAVELERAIMRYEHEKAKAYHLILDERMQNTKKYNEQMLLRWRSIIEQQERIITDDEYLSMQRDIMELSLPWERILKQESSNFVCTGLELAIFNDYARYGKKNSLERIKALQILEQYLNLRVNDALEVNFYAIFNMILPTMGDEYGAAAQWEKANKCSQMLARISLETRRSWLVDRAVYDLWWNDNEQKKATGLNQNDDKTLLQCCTKLASFHNLEFMVEFYMKKLEELIPH